MPRAEFATYAAEPSRPSADAETPRSASASRQTTSQPAEASDGTPLRVLVVEQNAEIAEQISAMLADIFGDGCARDWAGDPAEAAELIRQNLHDLYLITGSGVAEIVRSSIQSGCEGAFIVLAETADSDADLRALGAGAADYIPFADLSADRFERSIRHALVRQESIIRTRRELDALTTEKTRLNLLRDANHRFVENACHDFRSPLTVIKEFSSIIAEGLAGDVSEEQAEFLGIILTRVDHLSQMVDGILDASRLESDLIGVRREEHVVAKLIEHARPTLEQRAAAHKVNLEISVPDNLPTVFADIESIGRVLVNLGANACKYAGENGKIRVWARYNPNDHDVTIGITDSGPGIAPEHVKLIFDRFKQIPDEKGREKTGFGMGLHIASELVRVNFGTLAVDSEPQKGSTFTFTLPIFDVNALIPLHFGFLRTARQAFQKVSIAYATAPAGAESASLAEAEKILNRQLRSYDLLLRLREGNWLLCAAGDTDDLTKITDRIAKAYAETSRNRPEGRLPDIKFRPIGAWALSSRPEGLTDALRGAAGLSPDARGIH